MDWSPKDQLSGPANLDNRESENILNIKVMNFIPGAM